MESGKAAIERAFELAQSGEFYRLDYLIRRLDIEGYNGFAVSSAPTLRKQLTALIRKARGEMPTGPKGQKRPADVVGNAIKVARIATGEDTDELTDDGKDKAAQSMGRRGGCARAKALSPNQRKAIAKAAAQARWKK